MHDCSESVQSTPIVNRLTYMSKRANKYLYLRVVQGNYGYGHGWEDVAASEDFREARADLKAYRVNDPGNPYRMIKRRELNEER